MSAALWQVVPETTKPTAAGHAMQHIVMQHDVIEKGMDHFALLLSQDLSEDCKTFIEQEQAVPSQSCGSCRHQ